MKKYFLLSLLLIYTYVNAEKCPTTKSSKTTTKENAAGCLPATGHTELKINNVRARINTGGDMWWDLQGLPLYEIPKGSKKNSMFSASLWIGGLDVNGQLKLAALRYRQVGNDYWPGPLSIDGTASIDAETCVQWDKHFIIFKQDVVDFIGWHKNPNLYPGYTPPRSITEYPAHGDPAKKQARYLAPFYDVDGDGEYNWEAGDYPYYDFDNKLCPLFLKKGERRTPTMGSDPTYGPPTEKGGLLVDQVLKGDQTIWWIFNDKGNVHTETNGAPIGLEIRAQAFAFQTNDEINNMTFYSYEIINRSTYRLTETYFSQWVDSDIGYAFDDYVGCDVKRGLGYSYNGKAVDGTGLFSHYGAQPPAIGVDFFQGPYIDPDGIDNPKFRLEVVGYYNYIKDENGIIKDSVFVPTDTVLGPPLCDESINGVNFGNGIIDDERFGMRRFVYHNNTGMPWPMTDPEIAPHYYNMLRGIWKDGTKMLYGGNAHINSGAYGPECDFMFPGDSDPCLWGTGGKTPNGPVYWTEETAGNIPYDRRFMQSAGPFTLEPGAVNYITVGIPWARAVSGGPFASVELLRLVDDKCQRLFDNCFRVVDGPTAPDLTARELDRELILYITNKPNSNNYQEKYVEYDPSIVSPDTLHGKDRYDSLYRFEGYQIYQVISPSITAADIHNQDVCRLVAQCDIKNGVKRLINYYFSESLNAVVPVEEVNGADEGIVHSFRILEDKFATGDKRLVNNKKYYYMAVAYAYNEYEKYSQDPAFQQPGVASLYGQKKPYLRGRLNIKTYTFIPRKVEPLYGGTKLQSEYGDGFEITRIEGHGNGGIFLDLSDETINEILKTGFSRKLTYKQGQGPLNIKVIDPLNIKAAKYRLRFNVNNDSIDYATWTLEEIDENGQVLASYDSERAINFDNEQLFKDLGFSIQITQSVKPGTIEHKKNGFINATLTFADSSLRWLSFVPDMDALPALNWIRSGTLNDPTNQSNNDYDYSPDEKSAWLDPDEHFEKVLNGAWAPYRLASRYEHGPARGLLHSLAKLEDVYSIDVVFTPDKSKWTRCPVIETGEDAILSIGNAAKFELRKSPSVDKDGKPDGTGTGMGWFPGYAINVETGERLNVMFGESSWLKGENGGDMMFNPTDRIASFNDYFFGGKHFLYIFGNFKSANADLSPRYDEGKWAYEQLSSNDPIKFRNVYRSIMWVSIPIAAKNQKWLACEAKVRIRVCRPYAKGYSSSPLELANPAQNNNWPLYEFTTHKQAAKKQHLETAKNALSLIKVVPNPYYSYSAYETTQLENLVKITNLPQKCTVTIYTMNGTMIRQFTKDDPSPIIEWDLKNYAGIPISGGIYLIHVDAPGIGETTIKWFATLRPLDLNSF